VIRANISDAVSVALKWKYHAVNSLRDAELTLDEAQGCILTDTDRRSGIATLESPRVIKSKKFVPYYQDDSTWTWKEANGTGIHSNSKIVEMLFEKFFHLLDRVSRGELKFDWDAMLARRRS
jgi:hypothetical protein